MRAFEVAGHSMFDVKPQNARIKHQKGPDKQKLDERNRAQNIDVHIQDLHHDDRWDDQDVREKETDYHRA